MSLRNKILLPVMSILIAVVASISVINYFIARQTVTGMVDTEMDAAIENILVAGRLSDEITDIVMRELDSKNIALARSLAEIVRLNPGALETDEMTRLAHLLNVTEIHVADEGGILQHGNVPGFFGFDFASGDQARPFLQILTDPTFELAQEAQPNEVLGAMFAYTGVARTDAPGFVQIGIEAYILDELTSAFDIQRTIEQTRLGENGFLFIVEDGIISAHPNVGLIGMDFTPTAQRDAGEGRQWMTFDGEEYYAGFYQYGNRIIYSVIPEHEFFSGLNQLGLLSIIVSVLAILVMGGVVVYVSVKISAPIINISTWLKHAGTTGDLTLSEQDYKDIEEFDLIKGEIGELSRYISAIMIHVNNMASEVGTIAKGDLTNDITLLSDDDTMGSALKTVMENLNSMFGEIQSTTAQVAIGSKQLADGSQALAQGSTEQSASVQQLSSSITEIAQKTKENAGMAEKAAMLANDIKVSAEKGSRQMDEMMTAVKDINASSQNISKVIKSIDDIAFQTNILALNAAVEAARAGQHGKGFAVVAEEVRNLAAKSAEAAKDTESLIADSIEKAELGSKIADDTAASLTEIVAGIGESNQIVGKIAKSSEEQSAGIVEINKGIDQVAQIVQQNSATAQESAAASDEMSGQSVVLEELISRFKLKDSGVLRSISAPAKSLPAHEEAKADEAFGKY